MSIQMNGEMFKLSHAQSEIAYFTQMIPRKTMLNIPTSVILEGETDEELLRKAAFTAIERCQAMSLRLHKQDGEIMQYFSSEPPQTGEWDFSRDKDGNRFDRLRTKDVNTLLYDFDRQLYTFYFIKTFDGMTGLYCNIHHIIADNSSVYFFWSDLLDVYNALRENKPLPKAPAPFKAGIEAEEEYYNSPRYEEDRAFWTNYYSTVEKPTFTYLSGRQYLDAFRKRIKDPDAKFAVEMTPVDKGRLDIYTIPAETVAKLEKFCFDAKTSMYIAIQTAFGAYYCAVNETDRYASTLIASNRATWAEKTCGGSRVNINSVVLDLDRRLTFRENCQSISKDIIVFLRHMRFPYLQNIALLYQAFNLGATYSIGGLSLSYQFYRFKAPEGLKIHTRWYDGGHSNSGGYFTIVDDDNGGLRVYADVKDCYAPKVLTEYIMSCVTQILEAGISDDDSTIGEIMDKLPPMPDYGFKLPPLLVMK